MLFLLSLRRQVWFWPYCAVAEKAVAEEESKAVTKLRLFKPDITQKVREKANGKILVNRIGRQQTVI